MSRFALMIAPSATDHAGAMDPKNLLIVMSDEHNPKMLGCAGHGLVRTPHLDGLAARGTRFATAYTPSPICVPARAAFATGRYPHETGYWDNSLAYDGRVGSWGHALQRAGVRVESIGKLHYRAATDSIGFDRQHVPMHIKDGIGMVGGLFRGQFPGFEPPAGAGSTGAVSSAASPIVRSAGPGETEYIKYDLKIADLAGDWIEAAGARAGDRPWTLFVSFVSPHYPLTVPEKYLDLYDPADIPLPKLDPSVGLVPHPWWARLVQQHSGPGVTDDMKRRAVAAYLALCTFLDDQVGRVLAALEAAALARDTRVIYASDHGENAGARGLWGKSVMYEEAAGIPLILAGPDVSEGKVAATPASLVDGYPTILDAFGLPRQLWQTALAPRSLFELAAEPDDPERPAFSEYHAMRSPSALFMLRRGRFKLHHYVGYDPELFDLDADPEETENLAGNDAYRPVLAELESALAAIVDPEAVDARAKADQKAFIDRLGGPETALKMAAGGRNYTEVPPEVLAVL